MKTTYLVFENGIGSALRIASEREWDQILAANRSLPRAERRFFIKDCIESDGYMDCMYIETTKAEYDRWHSAHQVRYKKRMDAGEIQIDSLDISTQTEGESAMIDTMTDGIDWEERTIEQIRMKELREKLTAWRDWANELLDYYLCGMKMEATAILSEKYGLSEQLIRRRKREFEAYIKNNFDFS